MNATPAQIARFKSDMEAIAQTDIHVDFTPDYAYARGPEIGILRIFAKYQSNGAHPSGKTRINMLGNDEWLFSLRTTPEAPRA